MSRVITVRNIKIGEGVPKIIVPVVEKTRDKIVETALRIKNMKADAIEWRADFYNDAYDIKKAVETAEALREALPDMPLLFTFRTDKEGGEKSITMEEYADLNKALAQSGAVDMIDIQVFSYPDEANQMIAGIHESGAYVVASYHDFTKAPGKNEILERFRLMQDMGADILKIAVMPESLEDVLTFMAATNEMYHKYAKKPLVAISMSPAGVLSRVAGEFFGSSMTFGTAGQSSAPGQIPVDKLSQVLNILHESCEDIPEREIR